LDCGPDCNFDFTWNCAQQFQETAGRFSIRPLAGRGPPLREQIPTAMTGNGVSKSSVWNPPDFRPDLAFPKLTEEMVELVRSYARE